MNSSMTTPTEPTEEALAHGPTIDGGWSQHVRAPRCHGRGAPDRPARNWGRARMDEAGEVRGLHRDLHADARLGIHISPGLGRRRAAIVSWVTTVVFILEIVIIDLQAWRGTTSHFNVGTVLDGVMFTVMGLAIVVQTLSAVAVAVALWRQNFSDKAIGWALRLGMTITIIGAMSGGLMTRPTAAQLDAARAGNRMTVAGAHTVGAPDGGPGLPVTGWSRDHGDLRVAHFLGLHALQMLPLLTFVLARRGWNEARRVRVTLTAAASYIALFGLLMWQALRGQSITGPDVTTLTTMALWAVVTGVSLWMASYRSDSVRAHAIV